MSSESSSHERAPRLGSLLRLASQVMGERHVEWLKSSGFGDIQPAHSAVFQPLWEHPEGIRLTTLARASRITKQSMSALVDHLEAHAYLERVADPGDARASLLRLTTRGRAFTRAVRAFVEEQERDWAARVGARRLEDMRATLEMLRRSWLAED